MQKIFRDIKKSVHNFFHPAPDSSDAAQQASGIAGHPIQFRIYQAATIAAYIVILTLAALFWNAAPTPFGTQLNFGPGGLLLVALHLLASLKLVHADETAAAFSFGKGRGLKRLRPGLHFVPAIFMGVQKETQHIQDTICPGKPEDIFRRDDNRPLQPGQVQPIRIVTGGPKANTADTPDQILEAQMTLEVIFIVLWRVTDMLNFVTNYGSKERIERQILDVGTATLGEDFSQKTPKQIIETLADINKKLVDDIGKRFPHAGFAIESARLESPDVSHGVSTAMANIPVQRAKAAETRIQAAAERDKRREEGLGTADAREALLDAEAKGQKKIMDALKIDGELVIAAQTARPAAENAKVIIAGGKGGMADLLGLAVGAKEGLDATKTGATP